MILLLPLILWAYQKIRNFKQRISRFLRPAERRVFYLVANRYLVHSLIIITVFLAGASALQASSNPTTTGESSLLFTLFGEETALEENGLPLAVFEGENDFFLDLPTEELEPELPTTLQGQAMVKIDISPSGLASTRTKPEEYIIQEGDTVTSIAYKFGISINTILWENRLGVYDIIRPGQKLTILPTTGVSHKIKKGDIIDKIAKTYGVSKEEIIVFNGLASDETLIPDQILIIPGGVPFTPPRPRVAERKVYIPPTTPSSTPTGPGMLWPTDARRISQYFSWRHPGLDIAGSKGTPIYAVDDGVIVLVEQRRTGYGYQIMVDHGNGFKTRYGHNSQNVVSVGQRVKKGEVIALMGSTGRSSGNHVHFEVYAYGKRVNPFNYIKR